MADGTVADGFIELGAFLLYLAAFCSMVGIMEFIGEYNRKRRRRRNAVSKRRRAMRTAIYEKNAADYYNMAVRHMKPVPERVRASEQKKADPIRLMKGIFAQEYYSLDEDARKQIL